LPSVNRLAEMFSTSRNTSVKAINDLTHEGIIYCVQGKGSVVNDLRKVNKSLKSRRLKTSKTSFLSEIGVLLADFDDITHPYLAKILKGISQTGKIFPCNLKTFCINNCSFDEFIQKEVFDGLIVLTELPRSSIRLLKQYDIPFVLAGNDLLGEDLLSVTVDSFAMTYMAIEHLYSLGHEKISVLSGPSNSRSTPFAYAAYNHALGSLNLNTVECCFRSCDYGEDAGYKKFSEILDSGKHPNAVFASEDFIAMGVIRAAEERSIAVPEELSIIGTGDMFHGSNVKIPLTTFDTRLEELGRLCLDMLLKQLNNTRIKQTKVSLKPELLLRKSCVAIDSFKNKPPNGDE
jgi:LacI family transcriptional regulator, galactose operon repressor